MRSTAVGDLVTPLTGPIAEVALKVKGVRGEDCVVYRPGRVLRKREVDPISNNSFFILLYKKFQSDKGRQK